MKILSYNNQNTNQIKIGLLVDNLVYDLNSNDHRIPNNMKDFLEDYEYNFDYAKELELKIIDHKIQANYKLSEIDIACTVNQATSCRDGYAFRQHVASARRNRGVPMIEEFDQYPIFYFTNHNALQGPGEIWCMPDHFQKLDFELEVAVVLGKRGKNIRAEYADQYIAGYMIMNDMSARTLQMEEMLLNLGPAKGKDFSTVIGPWMVTPEELEPYKTSAKPNHVGNNYNLKMTCKVNGIQVSEGNMADMDWTFAEIIERCAYGVDVFPGEVIGSGTVGTGCFLELNGTGLLNDKTYKPQWLQPNDVVELEIEALGSLKNTIKAYETDYSILKLKKGIL